MLHTIFLPLLLPSGCVDCCAWQTAQIREKEGRKIVNCTKPVIIYLYYKSPGYSKYCANKTKSGRIIRSSYEH